MDEIKSKLADLSVSMEHLTRTVEIAEYVTGALICTDLGDDKEKAEEMIERLWSLLNNVIELSHSKEEEIDGIFRIVINGGVANA